MCTFYHIHVLKKTRTRETWLSHLRTFCRTACPRPPGFFGWLICAWLPHLIILFDGAFIVDGNYVSRISQVFSFILQGALGRTSDSSITIIRNEVMHNTSGIR